MASCDFGTSPPRRLPSQRTELSCRRQILSPDSVFFAAFAASRCSAFISFLRRFVTTDYADNADKSNSDLAYLIRATIHPNLRTLRRFNRDEQDLQDEVKTDYRFVLPVLSC